MRAWRLLVVLERSVLELKTDLKSFKPEFSTGLRQGNVLCKSKNANIEQKRQCSSSLREATNYASTLGKGALSFKAFLSRNGFCPRVPVRKSRYKGPNYTQQLANDSQTKTEQW